MEKKTLFDILYEKEFDDKKKHLTLFFMSKRIKKTFDTLFNVENNKKKKQSWIFFSTSKRMKIYQESHRGEIFRHTILNLCWPNIYYKKKSG